MNVLCRERGQRQATSALILPYYLLSVLCMQTACCCYKQQFADWAVGAQLVMYLLSGVASSSWSDSCHRQ